MTTTKQKQIKKRPPVIVVMGHIDHGKSTLLDYIRKSNTVAGEAGGITQALGAYEASYTDKNGATYRLTFIDTPGHEAFGAIREWGTRAADLAVLLVSGEDGVKPQTLEALKRIREAKLPFVVAINKIDRPGADVERTKANLAEHEVYLEGYGGDVPWVAISALKGTGVPELLDMLVLMAELQNLTGDSSKKAEGLVIEAEVEPKKGVRATLIIKNGTLLVGDAVVSEDSFSPVRAIEDFTGKHIKEASCGSPAGIVGWNKVPRVGATFIATASRNDAEKLAGEWLTKKKTAKASSDETQKGTVVIPIAIKADTVGSLEAIRHELKKINVEGVHTKLLVEGVGPITEGDIKTVSSNQAPLIIGFNVKIDAQARAIAEREHLNLVTFDIIYKLTEWLAAEIEKRRPRTEVEEETGRARILKLFSSEKGRYVIGGRVDSGSLKNGNTIKIMRRDTEISRGKIRSLQQQKLKVEEVAKDKEFGAQIESKIEPAPGDSLEAFTVSIK